MKTKSLLIFTILLFLQPIANYAITIKDEDPEEIILDKAIEEEFVSSEIYSVTYINVLKTLEKYTIIIGSDEYML